MDLSSVQARQAFNCEGIREVKGSLSQAIEATKKDGLKEVFFKAGDKEYVAYGKDMDVSKLKNTMSGTFKGTEISIDFTDDETNTAWGGAKAAVKSTAGAVTESVGAVVGGGLAFIGSELHGVGGGGSLSSGRIAGNTLGAAAFVAVVTTAIVGTVGAIHGGMKEANYDALKGISQEIK